jgi:hypothetical protein
MRPTAMPMAAARTMPTLRLRTSRTVTAMDGTPDRSIPTVL